MPSIRRVGAIAALAAVPAAAAYRFALVYRSRAGYPRRRPPAVTPADLGMAYETLAVESHGVALPAWFIPAEHGRPAPGVLLVHGWESARDRTLPNAQVLHAAGFHVLTFDVRGHGTNPPEDLPVSGGEFGSDAQAGVAALLGRPEVTRAGILGHSMGGIGAMLAAAREPRVEALVVVAAPADPIRLTRLTFRLANLPIPDPIAWPLAWLTTRVFVRPRRHDLREISAARAIARYRGPILLIHGGADAVVPTAHHERLVVAARSGRASEIGPAVIETLIIPEGDHSWLYESPEYRRAVAEFFARTLGGPFEPAEAGARAEAVPAARLPDTEGGFTAVERQPTRFRTIAELAGARIRPIEDPRPPGGGEPEPEAAA